MQKNNTNFDNYRRDLFLPGKRDYSVDIMRCISCLMVVGVHTAAGMTGYYPLDGETSFSWSALTLLQCMTVSATNLFLMISGIFFLSPSRTVTPTMLWSKNILKLAMAYVLWSIIYALFRIYYLFPRDFSVSLFKEELLEQEVHLWYIPMMLGIYMLVPLMRVFSEHAERKHYVYLIWLFVGAVFLNTVIQGNEYFEYNGEDQISTLISFTPYEMIIQYPVYCILGYFLYTNPPKLKTRIVLYFLAIAGVVFMFFTAKNIYEATGVINSAGLQGKFVIGTLARNTGLFVFVINFSSRIRLSDIIKKIVSKLSAATLFIYLYHILPLRVLIKEEFFFEDGLPTIKTALLDMGMTYIAGFIISLILLQSVPWIKARDLVLDKIWPNRRIWRVKKK